MFKRLQFWLLLCAALLSSACSSATTNTPNRAPCWLETPWQAQQRGAIGIASPLWAGAGPRPAQFSRQRAVLLLAQQTGHALELNASEIDLGRAQQQFGALTVYFAPEYRHQQSLISYASLDPLPEENAFCTVSRCQPERCEPAWLCNPNSDSDAGVIGTSFRSDTSTARYQAALDNGLEQLELIHGVAIRSQLTLATQGSSAAEEGFQLSRHSEVQQLDQRDTLPLRITDQCRLGEQWFVRVQSPALMPRSQRQVPEWMSQPSDQQLHGAIGSVHGRVASSLLSDKIRLAIRRGLIALAEGKGVHIREELLHIEQNQGFYLLSLITQDTQVTVKAQVNGLFIDRGPNGPEVYAWVVEAQ